MSGVEIALPVIAAVFALVSAFKDGGTIAKHLKERRQLRGVQPPSERLHRVLEQGILEVESSQVEGVEDFGAEFQVDVATASKLKDVTIVLQDSIIKELAAAYQNDNMDDFTPAINAVIKARREAVGILNGHYLDLQKRRAQGSSRLQPQPTSPSLDTVLEDNQSKRYSQQQQHLRSNTLNTVAWGTSPSTEAQSPHQRQNSVSHTGTPHWESSERVSQSPQMRTKSGFLGIFARRSSINKTANLPQQVMSSPPPSHVSSPEEQRKSTTLTLPNSPPGSEGLPSPALRRASTATSLLDQTQRAYEIVPICKENNYSGLCKCAHYAQSYELKKAMEPSMREYEWLYHCRNCKYKLIADSSRRGSPHFDDRIQTSSSTLNFRCMFLFKSHVPAKDCDFRHYSCLLCLLTGRKSRTYVGEDQLFGHVVRHAGEVLVMGDGRQVALQGMIEVQSDGITNAGMESFDIYFPLEMQLPNSGFRRPSFSMLPESAISNISELDSNFADAGSVQTDMKPANMATSDDQVYGGTYLERQRDARDTSVSLPANLLSLNANRYHEAPDRNSTYLLSSARTTVQPSKLYELPGGNLDERVWKQDQTRYAELDATGLRRQHR